MKLELLGNVLHLVLENSQDGEVILEWTCADGAAHETQPRAVMVLIRESTEEFHRRIHIERQEDKKAGARERREKS
jgi:hypothetical protein